MEDIQLPALYCPFAPRMSPHVNVAQEHVESWMQHFRLLQGVALQQFSHARMGWLVARCYPTATANELSLLADWLAWLFLIDDLFSEGAMSHKPEQIQPVMVELFSVVDGTAQLPQRDDPIFAALYNLWQRTIVSTPLGWRKQFLGHFRDYFVGTYWETQNRAHGLVPDIDTYIEKRRFSSGMLLGIDFIDLVVHMDLPDEIRSNDEFRTLLRATNNIVCWANDMVSLRKELEHQDVNNIVLIAQHMYCYTLQEALNYTSDLIRAETELFLDIEQKLPMMFPMYEREIQLYTLAHRAMVRGNLDWSYETSRYVRTEAEA